MNTAFAYLLLLRFEWGAVAECRTVKLIQIHAVKEGEGLDLTPIHKTPLSENVLTNRFICLSANLLCTFSDLKMEDAQNIYC